MSGSSSSSSFLEFFIRNIDLRRLVLDKLDETSLLSFRIVCKDIFNIVESMKYLEQRFRREVEHGKWVACKYQYMCEDYGVEERFGLFDEYNGAKMTNFTVAQLLHKFCLSERSFFSLLEHHCNLLLLHILSRGCFHHSQTAFNFVRKQDGLIACTRGEIDPNDPYGLPKIFDDKNQIFLTPREEATFERILYPLNNSLFNFNDYSTSSTYVTITLDATTILQRKFHTGFDVVCSLQTKGDIRTQLKEIADEFEKDTNK